MNSRRSKTAFAVVAIVLVLAVSTAIYVRRMPDVRADSANASLVVTNRDGSASGPFRYALAFDTGDDWDLWLSTKPLSCRAIETGAHMVEGDNTLELAFVDWPQHHKEGLTTVQLSGMRAPICKTSTSLDPPPPRTSTFKIESMTDPIRGTLRVFQRGDVKGPDPCGKPVGTYYFTGEGQFAAPICSTPLQRIRRWFR